MPDSQERPVTAVARRTVLRAGAVSWSVPVIVAAAAAPAFASSTGLRFNSFTAVYSAQGTATLRPDRLVVNASITNDGPATTGFTFEVLIPKGTARFGSGDLYDSTPALVGTVAGWTFSATPIVGDPTYKYRLTFTRTSQIASGGTAVLTNATIQFSPVSNAASPFKPFVGSSYTVRGVASATNVGTPVSATALVAESATDLGTSTTLSIVGFDVSRSSAALKVKADAIRNVGRKTCGAPITFSLVVPVVPGHRYYAGTPSASVTPPTGWTYVGRSATAPWTYTFTRNTPTALAPYNISGNSEADASTPSFGETTITLSDAGSGNTVNQSFTATATASFGLGTGVDSD